MGGATKLKKAEHVPQISAVSGPKLGILSARNRMKPTDTVLTSKLCQLQSVNEKQHF
jgi:hypothetical protein